MTFSALPAADATTRAQKMDCAGLQFNTDCHIVVPSDKGLTVLLFVLLHTHANPHKKLVVTGHTDSVGQDARNLTLSTDRALNVLWLLMGDRDRWAESSAASYLYVRDHRGSQTLADADVNAARSLDPNLPATDSEVWGTADAWKQVYDVYTKKLETWCGPDGKPSLVKGIYNYVDGNGKLPPLDGEGGLRPALASRLLLDPSSGDEKAVVGCAWQHQKLPRDPGVEERANRRIEFLWFDRDPHDAHGRLPFEVDGKIQRPERGPEKPPHDRWGMKAIVDELFKGPWEWERLECPSSIIELSSRTVFIVDCSGSMGQASARVMASTSLGTSYRNYFAACRALVSSTIDGLEVEGGDPQQFALLAFNASVQTFEKPDEPGPYLATEANKTDAKNWLKSSTAPAGYTNLWGAYQAALGYGAKKDEGWEIALFSDGLPTTGGKTNELDILDEAETKGIPINCYGFMSAVEFSDALREKLMTDYLAWLESRRNRSISGRARGQWCREEAKTLSGALKKELEDIRDRKVLYRKREQFLFYSTIGDKKLNREARAANVVEQALLGWFLSELAKRTGGTYTEILSKLESL